jgi:Transposase, Mutator family
MQEVTASTISLPGARGPLQEVLRRGAQTLLAQAIEAEVAEWIDEHQHVTDAAGRRQVVRNGYLPERKLVTGVGEVSVQQPRVHDRRPQDEREHFSSKLLPPYLRKTKSIEELRWPRNGGFRREMHYAAWAGAYSASYWSGET